MNSITNLPTNGGQTQHVRPTTSWSQKAEQIVVPLAISTLSLGLCLPFESALAVSCLAVGILQTSHQERVAAFRYAKRSLKFSIIVIPLDMMTRAKAICLAQYFPSMVVDPINRLGRSIARLGIRFSSGQTGAYGLIPFVDLAVIAPLFEEVVFRGLIQETLLRRFPKMILNKIAPHYTWVVECQVARISRIALSCLIFALAHTGNHSCLLDSGVGKLIGGLVEAYAIESTGSILLPIASHISYNGVCALLVRVSRFGSP